MAGGLMSIFHDTEMTPTTQAREGVARLQAQFGELMAGKAGINQQLKKAGLKEIN